MKLIPSLMNQQNAKRNTVSEDLKPRPLKQSTLWTISGTAYDRLRRGLVLVVMSFVFLISIPAHSSEGLKIKDSFLYGFCIHLGFEKSAAYNSGPNVELKLSQLGANATRDDLSWDIRKARSLQTLPQNMHKIAYGLNAIQARPLLILTGNAKAIPEGQPASDQSRQIYAAYAKDAAIALKSVNPIFEIWNEWNTATRRDQALGSPESYVALAKATYPELKKIMPNGTILAGAVGDDKNWEWTLKAVKLGLMDYADGLSIHPYNYCAPETIRTGGNVLYWVKVLHQWLEKAAPNKKIPLYLSELGWPDQDGKCGGVSAQSVGDNIAQVLLEAPTLPWLKGVWFYELLDQGQNPENREHHFGMYSFDGKFKLAGCMAKTAWDFIADTTPTQVAEPFPKTTLVSFKTQTNQRRVAVWDFARKATPHQIFIPAGAHTVSLCGSPVARVGSWTEIQETPLLIELPESALSQIKFKETRTEKEVDLQMRNPML